MEAVAPGIGVKVNRAWVAILLASLGGVAGSFGDRYGRKKLFLVSTLAMATATVAIALVPSYGAIGVAAPALLILLRMVQGLCFAGELPCSVTYVVEEMPQRAGLASSAVIALTTVSILAATLTSLGIRLGLPAESVRDYGWRIAFLVGGALGFVSYRFRGA